MTGQRTRRAALAKRQSTVPPPGRVAVFRGVVVNRGPVMRDARLSDLLVYEDVDPDDPSV